MKAQTDYSECFQPFAPVHPLPPRGVGQVAGGIVQHPKTHLWQIWMMLDSPCEFLGTYHPLQKGGFSRKFYARYEEDGKIMWTDEQIEQWYLALRAYREDSKAKVEMAKLRILRHQLRKEMLHYLTAFLEGRCTLQDFNKASQRQPYYGWYVLEVRGIPGGMFLDKLIKDIPDEEQLGQQLRAAFPAPKDAHYGRWWMQGLVFFLERMIGNGQVSCLQLQPARLPFFLSAWWHLQEEEQWPRFTGYLRQNILTELSLSDSADDQIELYLTFRERFLALKKSFSISAWELEHFLAWQEQRMQKREKRTGFGLDKARRGDLPSSPARRLYLHRIMKNVGLKGIFTT